MASEIRMPPLGQTTEDLKILEWLKSEGDPIAAGDELALIETDKANLAVESVFSGTLLKILTREGEIVQAGEILAYVGQPGEATPDSLEKPDLSTHAHRPAGSPSPVVTRNLTHSQQNPAPVPGKTLASPAARQRAKTHGVDLNQLEGTGPGGRIDVIDVDRAIAGRHELP